MILQGSLRIEYNDEPYSLMVKTFIKNGVYYFFVSDKARERSLLAGETLELTFEDHFNYEEKSAPLNHPKIPASIVSAVENMLLENKQLWFY